MKAWRRSVRDVPTTPPLLVLAQFTVISRILVLTFNRDVLNPLPFSALSLKVWSGTNRYEWSSTIDVVGHVIRTMHAAGVVDATPSGVQFVAPPYAVIDERGAPWASGLYPVTII